MKPLFITKRSLLRTIVMILVPTVLVAAAVYHEALSENKSLNGPSYFFITLLIVQTAHILIRFQKTMAIYSDRIEFTYTLFRSDEVVYFSDVKKIIDLGSGWFGYWWLWRIYFHERDFTHLPLRGAFPIKKQKEATALLYDLGVENEFNIHPFMLTKRSSGRAKSARR